MSRLRWSLLSLALVASASPVLGQGTVPRFEPAPCDYEPPGELAGISRECGFLIVPESRARPGGRRLRLAVLIYRASEPATLPPLLLLHGGPGGVGGTRFPWTEVLFPASRRRDVITFDMRGVGGSEPQFCPTFDAEGSAAFNRPTRREWEEVYRAAVRSCVASMEADGLDRTAFGADVNAADAADLRQVLGIRMWDVYGVSYGGLVAQELLRLDAAGMRSAALISTVSPGVAYAAEFYPSYQRNLDLVFGQCAAQPECAQAFPSLAADLDSLYAGLTAAPLEVPVSGASTPRTVHVDGDRFMLELRSMFQTPTMIARLPLLLHTLRRGDRDSAFRRLVGDGRVSSWGPLGRIVQCNEYGAEYRAAVAALMPTLRKPFRANADDIREHCDLWLPRLVSRADLRPVESGVPALIVHGEYDPMDIPGTQARISARLSRAYRYTLPGETHANPPLGCHGSIVQQFLENPEREPDATCLELMPRVSFRTTGLQPTLLVVVTPRPGTTTPFAGAWEAPLGGGPDWTLQLDTDGREVRGALQERSVAVEGAIDGATLRLTMKSPDGHRTISLTGTLRADTLTFTRAVEVVPGGNASGRGLLGGDSMRSIEARRVRQHR